MESAGDHKMNDEPKITVDADGDALADAAEVTDLASFDVCERRIRGAKQEGAGDADAFERLGENTRLKSCDVSGDVGEFRHEYQCAACVDRGATRFSAHKSEKNGVVDETGGTDPGGDRKESARNCAFDRAQGGGIDEIDVVDADAGDGGDDLAGGVDENAGISLAAG